VHSPYYPIPFMISLVAVLYQLLLNTLEYSSPGS